MKFLYAILNIQTVFDLEDVELNIVHSPLEAVLDYKLRILGINCLILTALDYKPN